MGFLKSVKNFLIPNTENVYRPGVLGRRSLLVFLGIILAAEGFLGANLIGRFSVGDFLAAVIGSEIIALTNTERAQAAVPSLTENGVLDAAAQRKADDMAAHGYFSHVGPDGKEPWAWISETGYDYAVAGENLAVRFVDSSDVVEAWMDSPTHKANIVKPSYKEIGVGIAQGYYKGTSATFVVQFFGTSRTVVAASPTPPIPPTQVENQVSAPSPVATVETEVAGESVAALGSPPAPVGAVSSQPASSADSLTRTFVRMFAEPRATTALVLGSVAALLIFVLALVFFIHIQVQPVDLLLRGSLVVFFALFLVAVNGQILGGAASSGNQAASLGMSGSGSLYLNNGVVIGDSGATTERFIVSQP